MRRGAAAGQRGVAEGDEDGAGLASGPGAASRPGAVISGAVDHVVREIGGAVESGRISGDITAAPATT
ncbi:hypothetical protein, partial [Streptomyces sp. KR55]|uniref:hypothetical protein n=1 Tax=Streptomyces sp. KR55 TaxID=3457425 RepID=UPI003FD16A29